MGKNQLISIVTSFLTILLLLFAACKKDRRTPQTGFGTLYKEVKGMHARSGTHIV